MTFYNRLANNKSVALAAIVFLAACSPTTSEAVPTCKSLGDEWYFPNACVSDCSDLGSTMDLDRSRNVNGDLKCYCVDREQPFCTDSPRCEDLAIFPATAQEDCAKVCGDEDATATTTFDDNGYQFHYVVSCSCGGKKMCGNDFVLFSDTDYMKSCSGRGVNSLRIANSDECAAFCADAAIFDGHEFSNDGGKSCNCMYPNPPIKALACDDATARFNDGSGLGDPCYDEVGVSKVDCPYSAGESTKSTTSATKTLVSSTAIMGVWLLPW